MALSNLGVQAPEILNVVVKDLVVLHLLLLARIVVGQGGDGPAGVQALPLVQEPSAHKQGVNL